MLAAVAPSPARNPWPSPRAGSAPASTASTTSTAVSPEDSRVITLRADLTCTSHSLTSAESRSFSPKPATGSRCGYAPRGRTRRIRGCRTTLLQHRCPGRAKHFRVIVPDHAGVWAAQRKGVDDHRPVRIPRRHASAGCMDELGIDQRAPGRQLLWRCLPRCGLALDTPHRVDKIVLDGARRYRHHPGAADRRPEEPSFLLRRLTASPRQARVCSSATYLVYRRRAQFPTRSSTCVSRPVDRPGSRRQPAAATPLRTAWRCGPCGGWTSPATGGWPICTRPTLVLWGRARQGQPPQRAAPMLARASCPTRNS